MPVVIAAIDPGPTDSGYVRFDGERVLFSSYLPNQAVLEHLLVDKFNADRLIIEKVVSYGMIVGAPVFETVFWSGIFAATFGLDRVTRLSHIEVKHHLCHSARAKDGNIRQAIIDRWGDRQKAIGTKAAQGPLYGVSGHCWSALAVAITHWDRSPVCV